MQTGKKDDRNTFFSQIADDCSFTFAGRQNEASSAHGLPSCRPVALHPTPFIYIPFNFPQRQMPEGGKRQPLSKVSDYFANSNARVSTKLLSLPKQFYRKTYNGK